MYMACSCFIFQSRLRCCSSSWELAASRGTSGRPLRIAGTHLGRNFSYFAVNSHFARNSPLSVRFTSSFIATVDAASASSAAT